MMLLLQVFQYTIGFEASGNWKLFSFALKSVMESLRQNEKKNTNIPGHFVRIYDIAEYRISMVNHKKKPTFFSFTFKCFLKLYKQ